MVGRDVDEVTTATGIRLRTSRGDRTGPCHRSSQDTQPHVLADHKVTPDMGERNH